MPANEAMKGSAVVVTMIVVFTICGDCSGTRMVQMEPGVEVSEPKLLSKGGARIRGYIGSDGVSHAFNGHVRLEGEQLHFQPQGPPRGAEAPLESHQGYDVDRDEVDALMVNRLHVGRTIAASALGAVLGAAVLAAAVLSFP